MPYNPQNIAALLAQMPNAMTSLQQGLKLGMMPREMQLRQAQEERAAEMQPLKDALLSAQASQARAQAQKLQSEAESPFGGKIPPGIVGQRVWLDKIKKDAGEDSGLYQQAKADLDAHEAREQALQDRYKELGAALSFRSLPAKEKSRDIAYAVGMGYDPMEGQKLLMQGKTLAQMAADKGLDLSQIKAGYAPTDIELRDMRKRSATSKELGFLDNVATDALTQFGRQFFNYTPQQVISAIRNNSPDEQGKFLAARAIAPEISALRLKAMQGQVGIGALKELKETALAQSKIFNSLVSPEARKALSKYMDKWISQGTDVFNKYIEGETAITGQPILKSSAPKLDYGKYKEEDVKHTAKINNLTEQQVLEILRKRNA